MKNNNCCIFSLYFVKISILLKASHLFNPHSSPTSVHVVSSVLQMKAWKLVPGRKACKRQSQDSHPSPYVPRPYLTLSLVGSSGVMSTRGGQ